MISDTLQIWIRNVSKFFVVWYVADKEVAMPRLSRAESMALTRVKLIDAGFDAFLKLGYAAATIDGIAEGAGFSRGAFYAHFASKEDLLLAGISTQIESIGQALIGSIETCSTPEEVIVTVADWAEARSQSRDVASLIFEMMQFAGQTGTSNERFAELFLSSWRGVGDALRRFFPDQTLPGTPEEIVAIIVALTYGPVVSGVTQHRAGRLVTLVLKAMMMR